MNIRMQLIRAGLAIAVIGGATAAETFYPAADGDCPFAKIARPQRILLLDPIQKHPTWIDARDDAPSGTETPQTVESAHADAARGVVTS
ncbi:MAG TPA: hypothetical protein VHE32_05085 [Rhodanobacteraceae bacterium]|jgi:hypothetical protein|nr:hypothetical protein [Rhodanobacteraceae bacterium]